MADKELNEITAADTLDGTESVHVEQSGNSRRTTTQALADLAPTFRGALVGKTAAETGQNISGAWTAISFDSEEYDTDTIHDNSTNNERLSVPSGVTRVRVGCYVKINNFTTNNYWGLRIVKNGSATVDVGLPQAELESNPLNTAALAQWSAIVSVTGGSDYFETEVFIDTDTSIDIAAECWFAMEIIE